MNNQTIVMCVVSLLLGMLLANMLKNVCGCKVVEGQNECASFETLDQAQSRAYRSVSGGDGRKVAENTADCYSCMLKQLMTDTEGTPGTAFRACGGGQSSGTPAASNTPT